MKNNGQLVKLVVQSINRYIYIYIAPFARPQNFVANIISTQLDRAARIQGPGGPAEAQIAVMDKVCRAARGRASIGTIEKIVRKLWY